MEDEHNGTLVCACQELGGISVAGWIVLMALLGLAMGAVLGALGALWFVRRRGKQQQGRNAQWRIHAGTQPHGTPINRANRSLLFKGDLSSFSPMAQYKQQKLYGDLKRYSMPHFTDGMGGTTTRSLHSPNQAVLNQVSKQEGSLTATKAMSLQPNRLQYGDASFDAREDCSCSHGIPQNAEGSFSPTSQRGRDSLKEPQQVSTKMEGAFHKNPVEEAQDVVVHMKALSLETKLDENGPKDPQTSNCAEPALQKQYELEELEPEWHGIMSLIDNMLTEQGRYPLKADERPVIMHSLLKSSPKEGVTKAMNDAVEALLVYRTTQGTADEHCPLREVESLSHN